MADSFHWARLLQRAFAATTVMAGLVSVVPAKAAPTTVAAATPAPLTQQQRVDVIKAAVARQVSIVNNLATAPVPIGFTRDLADSAYGMLVLGQDPKQAGQLLTDEFAQQVVDPKAADYGMLPWQLGKSAIHDPNSVEYGLQAIGPILIAYSDKLGPDQVAAIKPHVIAGIAAMRARHIKATYTNVWLMRCECFVLCGQSIGDADALKTGYSDLDQWLSYTSKAGIHEYDTSTYYAIDLNSLLLGYRYAADPQGRAKFKTALDLFWTDICANYFPARQDLSGPHSRDDDQLFGAGDLDNYLFLAGLRDQPDPAHLTPQLALALSGFSQEGYEPSSQVVALASAPYKLVEQSWEEVPPFGRTNYVTPGFSIGSSDGDFGSSDKPIDIELASAKPIPAITVVPDDHDQPYGKVLEKDSAGFSAPGHLPMHPVCVQSKNVLLALLDIPAPNSDLTTLATNVLLPAKADDLALDGKRPDTSQQFVVVGGIGSVVVVKVGKSAVAIRVFHADGDGNQPPSIALKGDPVGLKYGAARLAIYHYAGASRQLSHKHFKVGLLIVAGQCTTVADEAALIQRVQKADVQDLVTGHDWNVSARVDAVTLSLDVDLTGQQTPVRQVNGMAVQRRILMMNGTDLAGQILTGISAGQ
jgi:hypothetical protein